MLDDLIKSMFLGGFFSEAGADGDEAESLLEKALAKHKDPSQIFAEAKIVGLDGQILMLSEAVSSLAKERELLAEEVRRLQQENKRLQKKNAKLSQENIGLHRQNRQTDEEIARLQAMVSNLCTKLETAHPEANGGTPVDADESSASVGAETGGDESDGESEVVETGESPEAGAGSSTSSTSMSFCVDK